VPVTASHSRDRGGDASTVGQLPLEEIRQQPHLRVKVGDQPAGCTSAEKPSMKLMGMISICYQSQRPLYAIKRMSYARIPSPSYTKYKNNHNVQGCRAVRLLSALRSRKQHLQPRSHHSDSAATVLRDPREAAQSQRPSPTNPILSAWPSWHPPSSQSSRAASSLRLQA